jgi:signal transduction histidine kinase
MSGDFFLDWAVMAVSLFNAILTLWLGLTVLLNAERRSWGIWLTGGGLLLGALFFVSHSVILAHDLREVGAGIDLWWQVGWFPVIASPLAWYVVMLWYAGYWEAPAGNALSPLRRRQRPGLALALALGLALVGLLIFANPLPSYTRVAAFELAATPALAGIPLLIVVYAAYLVLCITLALDALRRPEPSGRFMGDLARRRARPWLVAASLMLLLVSLLVAGAMLWIVANARQRVFAGLYPEMAVTIVGFDLVIDALVAIAIVLLGQAMVSYEVFTGRTLASRGLRRQWWNAVILALGFSVVVGESLATELRPIYSLLLATILMTLFYALFAWRSYAERERTMSYLRPFVASQRLYERVLTQPPPASALPEVDAATPFHALCRDVLNTRIAQLIPLGPLAPLVGPPLTYPNDAPAPPALNEVVATLRSPRTLYVALDPARYGGSQWAVPLWSERGLIGVLLLGAKRDDGLYTQEEIEIARASGERLIDTQASAEIARRLMRLQRERLAESQLLDRRARRVLHDDVLPRLHTAMLSLSGANGASTDELTMLADVHSRISDLLHEMPTSTAPEVSRFGLVGALRKVVSEELGSAFDGVTWQLDPAAERDAQAISNLTAEVLFYAAREAIRNAARHGRGGDPARALHLCITLIQHDGLELHVEDDGVGLSAAQSIGASGQGLALHGTMMAVVGGTLAVESAPGQYTRVVLALPRSTR